MIKLLRPKQWIKNGFIIAPLLFSNLFLVPNAILQTLYAFCIFCLASSSAYIVNDIFDIESDKAHPVKCKSRPLAANQITIKQAYFLLACVYSMLLVGLIIMPKMAPVILVYLLINLSYSFVLKHKPVIDIFTIAIGFVLRVYAGAVALTIPVSGWMFVTTLCVALFLAAIKRRQEIKSNSHTGRKVLEQYSIALVDRFAEMSATGCLIFYSLFVITTQPKMVITIPFVIYGLFRYWYVVEIDKQGESPTDTIWNDNQLQLIIVSWIICCLYILWHA